MLGHDILLGGLADKRQIIEQVLLMIHLSCRDATGGLLRARRVDFRHQPLSPPATEGPIIRPTGPSCRVTILDRERLEELAGDAYSLPEAEYCHMIEPFGRGGKENKVD